MPELWANNAGSVLAAGITDVAASFAVQAGHGARFPSPTGGDFFHLTIDDGSNIEIVRVTARATDTLTVVRGQQGTTPTAFSAGARAELRLTAASLTEFTENLGGSAPQITVVQGITATDFYQAGVGDLPGAAEFTAIYYGFISGLSDSPQFLFGNRNMTGHGWAVGLSNRVADSVSYVRFESFDGTGSITVNSELTEAADYAAICMRPVHIAIRYSGGFLQGLVDGQTTRFRAAGSGYTAAAGRPFQVGCDAGVWTEPSTRVGFQGAGYIASGLTDAQIQDHLQACREAGNRFVAGAPTWAHRYDVLAPGGSFPTQIDDLVGTAHLARQGSAITATTTRRV